MELGMGVIESTTNRIFRVVGIPGSQLRAGRKPVAQIPRKFRRTWMFRI